MGKVSKILNLLNETVTVVSPLESTLINMYQDHTDEIDSYQAKLDSETRDSLKKFYKKKIEDLNKSLKGIQDMLDNLRDGLKNPDITKSDMDKAYSLVMDISRNESSFSKRKDLEKILSEIVKHEYDMDTSPVNLFNLNKVKEIYPELLKAKTYADYVNVLGGRSLDVYLKNLYSDPSKRFRPEED